MYVCMYVVEKGSAFKGVWIDMESSLRSLVLEEGKEGGASTHRDVFSVEKCVACIEAGLQMGMPSADD